MGSLEREPVIPIESRIAYLEGYLDALEKIRRVSHRKEQLPLEDLCFALQVSVKTLLVSGEVVDLPENLSRYPLVANLLKGAVSSEDTPNKQGP